MSLLGASDLVGQTTVFPFFLRNDSFLQEFYGTCTQRQTQIAEEGGLLCMLYVSLFWCNIGEDPKTVYEATFYNYFGVCLHIFVFILNRWRRRLSSTNSFVSGWALWWLVPRAQVKALSGSCCGWPLIKWARQWNTTQWTQRPCHELRLVFRDVVNFLWNGVNLFKPQTYFATIRVLNKMHWPCFYVRRSSAQFWSNRSAFFFHCVHYL